MFTDSNFLSAYSVVGKRTVIIPAFYAFKMLLVCLQLQICADQERWRFVRDTIMSFFLQNAKLALFVQM